MNLIAEDILMHYGIPKRSGRYPWGSGEDPNQRTGDFLSRLELLKRKGMSEKEIAESLGMSTTQLRSEKANARNERRMLDVATAKRLKEKEGMGATEIGRKMGLSESTVRSLLNTESEKKMNQAKYTAEFLKKQVNEKGMIDVGTGVDLELNISREKLNQALKLMEEDGYNTFKGGIPQVTNKGKQINQMVVCPPGTPFKVNDKGVKTSSAIYDYENVHSIKDYMTRDGGETYEKKFTYPKSMDSKRLQIRYKEDGGIEKDGVIELRRGVDDLSLGSSRYAQVRILVDGTHYLKGMAVYSDKMPDGVDVMFNTNKKKGTPTKDVLKKIKDDPDNPFGSAIKDAEKGGQYWYTDKNGKKQLGLINKRADEGDWTEWKDTLPSQFLSKQSVPMAKKQLGLAIADKQAEYDEICSLTNPTIKKNLLKSFADDCDSSAVHLKAAALPGQKYHVIIPMPSLKDTEIYAPNYENGTQLALIRYPHGGTFEIPIVTVNNKHAASKKLLGTDVTDAVCINSRVAERLSGADFDGDTVMCIPTHDKNGRVKIASTPKLTGLDGFDSKSYGADEVKTDSNGDAHYYRNGREYKIMGKQTTQTQMGMISNLITDMTLKGADTKELARAVRHSMVVIDAEKHKLDYKQSEIDNNIKALQKDYQSYTDANGKVHSKGASTLISRASGEATVDKRQGSPHVNKKGTPWYDPNRPEGVNLYKTADNIEYQVDKVNARTGEVTTVTKRKTQKSTQMAETDDATTLISKANTPMERAYADYANTMKRMANQARMTMESTGKIAYSAEANRKYTTEVQSLKRKLNTSLLNKPRERQAQLLANAEIKGKQQDNPDMDKSEIKKASQQALTKYRQQVGAKRTPINITDREWEAIQAGAISEAKLSKILDNTDADKLRERATPRASTTLSAAKINRIKSMQQSNYSLNEIARALGVSSSTVSKYLKGDVN